MRPKAEVDNILRDLQNSSYYTKAESLIVLLFIQNISNFLTSLPMVSPRFHEQKFPL